MLNNFLGLWCRLTGYIVFQGRNGSLSAQSVLTFNGSAIVQGFGALVTAGAEIEIVSSQPLGQESVFFAGLITAPLITMRGGFLAGARGAAARVIATQSLVVAAGDAQIGLFTLQAGAV